MKLLRERRADDFHYAFVVLHLVGLILLSMRSAELREWAFLGINTLGALFWLFVFAVKALDLPIASGEGSRQVSGTSAEISGDAGGSGPTLHMHRSPIAGGVDP